MIVETWRWEEIGHGHTVIMQNGSGEWVPVVVGPIVRCPGGGVAVLRFPTGRVPHQWDTGELVRVQLSDLVDALVALRPLGAKVMSK